MVTDRAAIWRVYVCRGLVSLERTWLSPPRAAPMWGVSGSLPSPWGWLQPSQHTCPSGPSPPIIITVEGTGDLTGSRQVLTLGVRLTLLPSVGKCWGRAAWSEPMPLAIMSCALSLLKSKRPRPTSDPTEQASPRDTCLATAPFKCTILLVQKLWSLR